MKWTVVHTKIAKRNTQQGTKIKIMRIILLKKERIENPKINHFFHCVVYKLWKHLGIST